MCSSLLFYGMASVIRLAFFNVMEEKRQNETAEPDVTVHHIHGDHFTFPVSVKKILWQVLPFCDQCGSGGCRSTVYQRH